MYPKRQIVSILVFQQLFLKLSQWDLFRKRAFSLFTKEDKKVEKAIADVGMSEFQGRNIGELSGGQQQRVFIARALVSDPELLILDEPTVGIDVKNVESFYEILEDLNKRLGITLILVTHDMGAVTEKVTHVACLNQHLHFHGNVEVPRVRRCRNVRLIWTSCSSFRTRT